jgi:hypothetical protein
MNLFNVARAAVPGAAQRPEPLARSQVEKVHPGLKPQCQLSRGAVL